MRIKDILLNGRIQTAGETSAGMAVGYVAGINSPDYLFLFFIILLALLYHFVGFTWNNIFDYRYDINDPHKSDLPLVSGRIRFETTVNYSVVMTVVSYVIYSFFCILSINPLLSFALMSTGVVSGFIYDIFNKRTNLGQIGILIAFPSMVLFAYSIDHPLNTIALLIFAYSLLQIAFLNMFTGQLKDIGNFNQSNFLRRIGAVLQHHDEFHETLYIPKTITLTGIGIKIASAIVAILSIISIYHSGSQLYVRITMIVVLSAVVLPLTIGILTPHFTFDTRQERIYETNQRKGTWIEIFGALIFIITFVVQPSLIFIFILYPIIWVVVFNRLFFGTNMVMKV